MRIGLLVPGFSASEADWCIPALLDLARELARSHEVRMLALRYPHERRSYQVHGAEVTSLGAARSRGVGRLAMLTRAWAWLRRETRRAPFDILHALWAHEPGFIATVPAIQRRIPTVVSVLGGELTELPEISYGGQLSVSNRTMTRLALTRATRVTVGSDALRELIGPRVSPERLRTVPLGVDADLFRPGPSAGAAPFPEGRVNLLTVASHVPVKGLDTLLEAFGIARERLPDLHLHLVGDGPCRADLETTARRLEIASQVTFHGHVPHERLPDYYRAADLCVLSSLFESQAMVLLEAAACGRGTVGTKVGLLPELVPEVYTCQPGDPTGLAAAVAAALGDRARLAQHEETLRLRVAAAYSVEVATRAFVELYEEAAAAGRVAGHDGVVR